MKTYITKINQWGNSFGIRIPKDIVDNNFSDNKNIKISSNGSGQITITSIVDSKILSKDSVRRELSSMKPTRITDKIISNRVGKEIW